MAPKSGKLVLFAACCLIALCSCSALAEGLGITSQFGYGNVWPNRQSTTCNTGLCTNGSCGAACPDAVACANGVCTATVCINGTCGDSRCPAYQAACNNNSTSLVIETPKVTVSSTPGETDGHYTTGAVSAQEQEAWNYVNQDRARQGVAQLTLDPELSRLARMKSKDMLVNRYFAHTSPTLGNAATMLRNNGYAFAAVGENISKHSTVIKSHAALMSSAGHRRNILGASWNRVGIGIALDQNGYVYMTQLFAR